MKKNVVINSIRMNLDLSEGIQKGMSAGTYEPEQTSWFKQCLKAGDVVVDVGASFGYYTTLGSYLVGSAGMVFAFEPSPVASSVVEEAIVTSNVTNVLLTKAALGNQNAKISLFLPNTSKLHSPSVLPSNNKFIPVKVPVIRLDEFKPLVSLDRNIKLVKIDVEGYEPNVLDGMSELILSGKVENIICEFNSGWLKLNSSNPKLLHDKFVGYGYKAIKKTKLRKNLPDSWGGVFSLQDIWFTRKGG